MNPDLFGDPSQQMQGGYYAAIWAAFMREQRIDAQLVGEMMKISSTMMGYAADVMSEYDNVFKPEVAQLVADANDYASAARIQKNMGEAESGVAQAFDAQRQNTLADLESFGIDPSSGRYAALDAASRTQEAAAQAGAGNIAEQQTEAIGRGLRSEAIQATANSPGLAASLGGVAASALKFPPSRPYPPPRQPYQRPQFPQAQNKQNPGGGGSSKPPPSEKPVGDNPPYRPNGSDKVGTFKDERGPMDTSTNPKGTDVGGDKAKPEGVPTPPERPSDIPVEDPFANTSDYKPGDYEQQIGVNRDQPDQPPGFLNEDDQLPDNSTIDTGLQDEFQNTQDEFQQFQDEQDMSGNYDPYSGGDNSGAQVDDSQDYQPTGGGQDWGGDQNYSNDYSDMGGNSSGSYDNSANYDDSGYARGGLVPRSASPSRGRKVDDVPARVNQTGENIRVNADEFIIPRDVVKWKGHQYFQNLIDQSRRARQAGSAKPTMKPALRQTRAIPQTAR